MGKKSLRIFTPLSPVEDSVEADTSSADAIQSVIPAEHNAEHDQINNLTQKERNLALSGVTRFKYLTVIAEALTAVKKVELPDAQGNYKWIDIPDVARRQWGAEQAAKLFGDMIERKEIEHDIGDKTLERFKAMSVPQLKARAMEILLERKNGGQIGHSDPVQLTQGLRSDTKTPSDEPQTVEEEY